MLTRRLSAVCVNPVPVTVSAPPDGPAIEVVEWPAGPVGTSPDGTPGWAHDGGGGSAAERALVAARATASAPARYHDPRLTRTPVPSAGSSAVPGRRAAARPPGGH